MKSQQLYYLATIIASTPFVSEECAKRAILRLARQAATEATLNKNFCMEIDKLLVRNTARLVA